ncbi:hypothetical protein BGZ95_006599 [Linnemannia exigua]|uniref:F-box domain-containing protein n=1 Tax=Linnemannia exigua TaxID=604196 RepID=A0AAD4DHM0_9FUNG|nr:hypothetical protein BGZ95_006599 [Linnemannia exigua]
MSTHSITIFEIPLILDLICEAISTKDVWACRRTCRLWCISFQPYVWHRVRLSRRTTRPRAAIQLLQQNAYRIRSLEVHISDNVLLGTACTRLVHLTCFGGGGNGSGITIRCNNSHRRDRNINLQDPQPAIATNLIAQNPHLERITFALDCTLLTSEYFPVPVLTALQQSTISTLELDLRQTYNITILAAILCYCPDTLTELTIDNTTARFEHTQFVKELKYVGGIKVSIPPWREFRSLVRLILRHSFKFQEEAILFPLLRHSPHLRELELPSIRMSHSDEMVSLLIESCPNIDRMLRFSEHDDLTHDRCLDILLAYPGLIELAFCYSEDMSPEVIEVLLEQSASTLEVLEVSAGFDTDNRERMGGCIERVLMQCPKLRRLKIVHEWEMDATGIQLVDLVKTHWASGYGGSGTLEELSIPIGSREFFCLSIADDDDEDQGWDGQEKPNREQGEAIDEEQTKLEQRRRRIDAGWVVALARKLKALPTLRTLKLWWMDPVLSLEDVLQYLREEEDFKEIDESCLRWMGLE